MVPSMFIPGIEEASSTYEDIWKHRDETENFQQKYDAELIKELKRSVFPLIFMVFLIFI